MSSRRIFLLLADALLRSRPTGVPVNPAHKEQHEKDCTAVANALAQENQAFDRERFLRETGVRR